MVNFQFDKILLARYIGLRSVADYDLGARLLTTTRSFPLMLLSALVPAISELDAKREIGTIRELARRSLRYLLMVATPAFAILFLEAERIEATMILQVHDELVFETTEAARVGLSKIVRDRMEGVAELSVPLTVDLGYGANWREAH